MTPNEFVDKATALKLGESFVYYTGYLGADGEAALATIALTWGTNKGKPIKFVDTSSNKGKIPLGVGMGYLTQRRIKEETYEYIYTRRGGSIAT